MPENRSARERWFVVRKDLGGRRCTLLMVASFLVPLLAWVTAAYGPFWKKLYEIEISAECQELASVYVPRNRLSAEYFQEFQEVIRKENTAVLEARKAGKPLEATPRQNKKVVRQLFPLAFANGWVRKDQEADDDVLKDVWLNLARGKFAPVRLRPSAENEAILRDAIPLLGSGDWPSQAILKLVPQAGVTYDRPVYLVPPHVVLQTAWEDLQARPETNAIAQDGEGRSDAKTLLQRYGESLRTIFFGFLLAAVVSIPLGILAGTYGVFSRLLEPFTDFFRYMPAPTFGVVLMAVFGLDFAPKIMLVFIGTFPHAILMIANTTRQLEAPLLEAAQTLGASQRQLVTHVVIPGILPSLYNDLRILLGWAWTWLVIAELLGFKSGLTEIIDTRGRRFQFEHVYPAILMIGLTGFLTDQFLGWLSRGLFPWGHRGAAYGSRSFVRAVAIFPRFATQVIRIGMTRRDRTSGSSSNSTP